jgi:hypothetical protein
LNPALLHTPPGWLDGVAMIGPNQVVYTHRLNAQH